MADVDFDRRLSALDEIDAPDLWSRARSMTPRRPAHAPGGGGRWAVLGTACVLSLTSLAFLIFAFEGREDVAGVPRENGPFVVVASGLEGRPPQYDSLFVVSPDGSAMRRLSDDLHLFQPDWSPDGSRIVFVESQRRGGGELSLMDADGSNIRRLTATPAEEGMPAWSPDGSRIAFVRDGSLWVMDADGTGQVRLLQPGDPRVYEAYPSWSPDGTKIAFVRPFDRGIFDTCPSNTGTGVFVMDSDGTDLRRLTIEGCRDRVAWSPSGESLAIIGSRSATRLLGLDGETLASFPPPKLPPDRIGFGTAGPVWSPDGRLIAFSLQGDIWTLEPSSGRWRQVTRDTGFAITDLDWGPAVPTEDRDPVPDDSAAIPGTCEYGPWIKHCPEAEWARSVASAAGVDVIAEEAVLILGPREGGEFHFWAMDPALHSGVEPLPIAVPNSTMVPAGHVGGIRLYATEDRDRFAWSVHGLNVWVGERIVGVPPPRRLVVALVRASESIPYTSGQPPSAYRQCRPPEVRPRYLPWIERGDPIPRPIVSYDAEIDRAQLSWPNPNHPPGEAGVGLTVYTHTPLGNLGEETDILVDGVAGRLHRADEAGLVGISWWLDRPECNYMELILADPGPKGAAIQELMRIARSLT